MPLPNMPSALVRAAIVWMALIGFSGALYPSAHAQDLSRVEAPAVLSPVVSLHCGQDGAGTPSHTVRENLIASAGLKLSPDLVRALETSSLGDLVAVSAQNSPDGQSPETMLFQHALALFDRARGQTAAALDLDVNTASELARRFLNGDTAILEALDRPCPPLIPDQAVSLQVRAQGPQPQLEVISLPPVPALPELAPTYPKRPWQQIMIARRKGDIIKSSRDRGSATFGIERDRAQDFDTINIEATFATQPLYVIETGSSGPGVTPTRLEFLPYLQYNRRSARIARDTINDLTLGMTAIARNPSLWGGTTGFGSIAWQSDDQGRASVLIGDAQIDFKSVDACNRLDLWQWDTRCNAGLVLDFASVDDAGQNARLALLDRYFRVGFNAEMVSERSFPFGVVRLTSHYVTRYDLAQNGAGGGLGTLTLGLRETRASNVSLEAGYSRGRTLNTLVDVDKVTLRIGYRR
jgi:hypothetical protein